MSQRKFRRLFVRALVLVSPVWMSCSDNPVIPKNDEVFFSSSFKSGKEGWTSWDNGETQVKWENDCCLCRYEEAGCLSITDAHSGTMAFRYKFGLHLGADPSSYYGKHLKYWMRVSGGDSWRKQPLEWNVAIESDIYGRLTMAFPEALQVDFPYRWQQVVLNLSATPSWLRGRTRCWQIDGHPASKAEIRKVLSNATNLLIYADFYNGNETAYLDDVTITDPGEPQGPDERICNGLPYMCEMPFDKIVFPGNHNSGSYSPMWECNSGLSYPAVDIFVFNQGHTISRQIEWGIRYFDIDIYYCVYFGEGLVNGHGAYNSGPPIRDRLDRIDNFLNSPANRNEVIVITIGDQMKSSKELLQGKLYDEILRWAAPPERLDRGELTIFTKSPGDPWPTLGYLVDSNRRIVFFVRDVLPILEDIGVLSERDYIHDTYKSRDLSFSCAGVVDDTYDSCASAPHDKLVLISVTGSKGLAIQDMAGLCNPWIDECLQACMNARSLSTGKPLLEATPNFIIADYTMNRGNMIGPVRDLNLWILQENGFPVSASSIDLSEGMTH